MSTSPAQWMSTSRPLLFCWSNARGYHTWKQPCFQNWKCSSNALPSALYVWSVLATNNRCFIWRYIVPCVSWTAFADLFLVLGYNVSIVAYGQSGAGKTYTIFGPGLLFTMNESNFGVVPRALRHIFQKIQVQSKHLANKNKVKWPVFSNYSTSLTEGFQFKQAFLKSLEKRSMTC